jgi:hypothetical protein
MVLEGIEKKFELSRKHVRKVTNDFKEGKTILQIIRSGTGTNTNYIVKTIRSHEIRVKLK